jgi:hypothetical protein
MGSNEITLFIRHTHIQFRGYLHDNIPPASLEHARNCIVPAFEDKRYTLTFVDELYAGNRDVINLVFEYGALGDKKFTYLVELINYQSDTNYQIRTRGFDPIIVEHKILNEAYDETEKELTETRTSLENVQKSLAKSVEEYNKLLTEYARIILEKSD